MSTDTQNDIEPVEDFRLRLRAWLADNMPRAEEERGMHGLDDDEAELADVQRTRELQRKLFDGGFAGIVFPQEYGGAGLTPAHQQVFNEEIVGYEWPSRIQVPTFQPCATVINEFGTHEQKLEHLTAIFKGEEIWMQFLSEPGGGSDVAGAVTTAIRDGDGWVLNGSKIWTTGAWWSDWGLCLARTNWDVPKHRGLSVFMLPIHQDGIEMHRIEMLNGSKEFCQEFITDVWVPDTDRIGDVDDGWTVGTRWMFYEKSFNISYYTTRPAKPETTKAAGDEIPRSAALATARRAGHLDDVAVRERVGEAHALGVVSEVANRRIGQAISKGVFSDQAAGLSKVLGGTVGLRHQDLGWELAGPAAGAWDDDETALGSRGIGYLTRQSGQIAGGTVEMSRNVVSERFLGMPREVNLYRDTPYREVPRARPGN